MVVEAMHAHFAQRSLVVQILRDGIKRPVQIDEVDRSQMRGSVASLKGHALSASLRKRDVLEAYLVTGVRLVV